MRHRFLAFKNIKAIWTWLFEEGSAASIDATGSPIRIAPWKTWNGQWAWYAVKHNNLSGQTPSFAIAKADHYYLTANEIAAVWAQYDDTDTWTQMDNVAIGASDLTFNKATAFPGGIVYIAHWPMYPFSRVSRKVGEWALNAFVSETPSTTNKIIGYSTSRPNGDGRTAPRLPFYGFKLTNATAGTKNKGILSTLNHPSETTGAFVFEGMIDWLLAGSPEAKFLLDYFEFYCYPCLNPQGVFGGYFRSCPEDATKDHNRYWDGNTLECIAAFRAAMAADTGGTIEAGLDFHSSADDDTVYADVYDNTDAVHVAFAAKLATLDAGYDQRNTTEATMLQNLWHANYSPKLAITIEQGAGTSRGITQWKGFGENIGKSLATILAQGRFTNGPGVGSRDFNGSTDRIDWATVATLTASPITISFWMKLDVITANGYVICIHRTGDAAYGIIVNAQSPDVVNLLRSGTTDLMAGYDGIASTGSWINIIVTHDGVITTKASVNLYKDGVLKTQNAGSVNGAGEYAVGGSWSLGGRIYSDTRNLDGKIAQLGVWNRVLTTSEKANLALGFAPDLAAASNLLFYFKGNTSSLVAVPPTSTGTADGTTQITGVGNGPGIIYG